MELHALNPPFRTESRPLFKDAPTDVVEIALLLPSNRAEALIDLARRRRQSVGQILRQLIDVALEADDPY